MLPRRVILVRNAQSAANVDPTVLARVPGPEIPLSAEGHAQAAASGHRIRDMLEREDGPGGTSLFLYVSPFRRSKETALGIMAQQSACLLGCREEPQLREQDTGQLQDLSAQERENMLRRSFSRFFFRFTSGESGSDVYDRLTAFLDHMMRDIDGGRFPEGTTLLVVTHGLALRLFLARWFHWTVHDFDSVGNPPYGEPVVLELVPGAEASSCSVTGLCTKTKDLYRLAEASLPLLGVSGRQELRTMLQPQDAWGRTMERTVAGAAG